MISSAPRYTILGFALLALGFSEPAVKRGIPFAERGKTVLRMDLYRAEDPMAPWLVFAHGGGFSEGARDAPSVVYLASELARRGINVASITYRLRQVGVGFGCSVPAADKREAIAWAAEDVGAAMKYLQAQGADWVAIGGSSAGAEAALHQGLVERSHPVGALVSFAGAVEADRVDWTHAPPLIGFHGTCDAVVPFGAGLHRSCSPDSPGAFLLHGDGALQGCAAAAGNTAVVWAYPGAGHEICNDAMRDAGALDAVAAFLHAASTSQSIASDFIIQPDSKPCAFSPSLPCR